MLKFKIFTDKKVIQGISDVTFGSMSGRARNKRAVKFLKLLGCDAAPRNLVWAEQVFGAKVHICKNGDFGKTIKGADGLISNIPKQILAIVSADCVPVLLFDPEKGVVAALHGSRISLEKGIIKSAILKMVAKFRSDPKNILVGIGPHIRKCHYFKDLTKKVFDELLKLGVNRKNIEDSKICTYCSAKKYFSHRKKIDNPGFYKERSSRFVSFIGLSEPTLKMAAESIKQGKILICPTDTVYGIIGDATNKKAVEKLFKIKKRKLTKPVPIFVKDIKTAKKLAYINKEQEKFLKKVWPGKVTVVLKRKKGIKVYGIDKETIGLRAPKHKVISYLLSATDLPLIGTSANIAGKPASTKIKEVLKQFKNQKLQPDLVIDAGNLPKSRPSKVVDLTGKKIKVLRK